MTTMERLKGRGILAWEFDGVLGRLTQAQSKGQTGDLNVLSGLVKSTAKLASTIRDRVTKRGDLAGQRFPGYSPRSVKYSPGYAQQAGLAPEPWPFPRRIDENRNVVIRGKNLEVNQLIPTYTYSSRAELQQDIGRPDGSYYVTGGMWRGLQVRGSGSGSAIIDFQGSSEGAGRTVRMRTYYYAGEGPRGGIMTRGSWASARLPAKVRNSSKGGAIYDAHRVHVLLPKQDEIEGIAESLGAQYAGWMAKAIDS